jgi:hypothetical protein
VRRRGCVVAIAKFQTIRIGNTMSHWRPGM